VFKIILVFALCEPLRTAVREVNKNPKQIEDFIISTLESLVKTIARKGEGKA
jgi:N-acetylglutamate synthase/N-acetylornithine aminotransferase